jgi:predicted GTPase
MKRVIICGAAGRDFHNFNMLYRENPRARVVAFTATQIPNIEGRHYPPELAGALYPDGIPIFPESRLPGLIRELGVNEVLFSYSDVTHRHVMHIGSIAMACGAAFILASPEETMLEAKRPVVSVCAVRTGCGKSQTALAVSDVLTDLGKRVVAIRHPMPYGDLRAQQVQRFARREDLAEQRCTVEEREEYEPHLERGRIIYAGVDYTAVLERAEKEAEVLLWEGGNNDTPFLLPDLEIVVVDPLRPGHELSYHPGETNFLRAHIIIINKINSARRKDIRRVEENIEKHNPNALVIKANSKLLLSNPHLIRGKKVLVVEDGPTLTHGEMTFGAGVVAAEQGRAAEIVDPRPWIVGSIKETYETYPHIGKLLPAMGYDSKQLTDLQRTINGVPCDVVVIATPVDLNKLLKIDKPTVRVRYRLEELPEQDGASPTRLERYLEDWIEKVTDGEPSGGGPSGGAPSAGDVRRR